MPGIVGSLPEGLVPALPPQDFLQPQKQGRLIKPVIKSDFQTSKVTNRYARNNNRVYVVHHYATEELKTPSLYEQPQTWTSWTTTTSTVKTKWLSRPSWRSASISRLPLHNLPSRCVYVRLLIPAVYFYRYRYSVRTGWPSVTILWLGEKTSLICNLDLGMTACTIVWEDPCLRYTLLLGN